MAAARITMQVRRGGRPVVVRMLDQFDVELAGRTIRLAVAEQPDGDRRPELVEFTTGCGLQSTCLAGDRRSYRRASALEAWAALVSRHGAEHVLKVLDHGLARAPALNSWPLHVRNTESRR